ncbi:MAG: hypothetical protein LBO72_08185 [Helicobacteraceae bacterium]|jgi:hypothetical protein|nr:hypothetical protein [Helicobacteraceae bacterium]
MVKLFVAAFVFCVALIGGDFVAVESGGSNVFLLDENGGLFAKHELNVPNRNGSLGLGDLDGHTVREEFERLNINARITKISTSLTRSIALDSNGEIWLAGFNLDSRQNALHRFAKIPLKMKISDIASGWDSVLLLDNTGVLYVAASCATKDNGAFLVTKVKNDVRFKKIAAAKYEFAALAIDANGALWSADSISMITGVCPLSLSEIKADVKFQDISMNWGQKAALIDEAGNLWYFENWKLAKIDGLGAITAVSLTRFNGIYALDKNGALWAVEITKSKNDSQNAFRVKRIRLDAKIKAFGAGIYLFAIDSEGDVWFAKNSDIFPPKNPEKQAEFVLYPYSFNQQTSGENDDDK